MNPIDELRAKVRTVRVRYDELSRGESAPLRRCRTAKDVALEGAYWRIGGSVAREVVALPHVVLQFPRTPKTASPRHGFSFGRFLRDKLGEGDGAALRFRRLLASGDRDELDHHLRGVLRLACAEKPPIDWGVLGADILWFFAESDNVRRRWAQDFYAPTSRDEASGTAAFNPNS